MRKLDWDSRAASLEASPRGYDAGSPQAVGAAAGMTEVSLGDDGGGARGTVEGGEGSRAAVVDDLLAFLDAETPGGGASLAQPLNPTSVVDDQPLIQFD